MEKYERGDTIRVTAVFTDPDTDALVDPTNPTCEVYDPDGTTQLSGAMSKLGTGTYQAECQTEFADALGYWIVRCYGTYNSKRGANIDRIKLVEVI